MLLASNVKEEAESILTLVPAQITFERLSSVVAHVYGVHGAALERNSTKFTSRQLGHFVRSVQWDQAGYICRLLL